MLLLHVTFFILANLHILCQAHGRGAAHIAEKVVACASQNYADHTRVVVLLAKVVSCLCQVSQDSRQDSSNPALTVPPHSCDHLQW